MPKKQDISKYHGQKEAPLTFISSQPGPLTPKTKSAIYSHIAKKGHQQRRQRRAEAEKEDKEEPELTQSSVASSSSRTNVAQLSSVPNSLQGMSAVYSHVAKRAHLQRRQQQSTQKQASQEHNRKYIPVPFAQTTITQSFETSVSVGTLPQPLEDNDVEEVHRIFEEHETTQSFVYDTLTIDMIVSSGFQFSGLPIPPQPYFGPVLQFWQANVTQTLEPNTYSRSFIFQFEMTSQAAMTISLAKYLSIEPRARNAMLYHRGETLRLLNESIANTQNESALSDINILTITMLIYADVGLGLRVDAMSHLRGLTRIIALRGGLGRIGVDGRLKAIVLISEDMVNQMCANEPIIEHTPSVEWSNDSGSQHTLPSLVRDGIGPTYSKQMRLLPAPEWSSGSTKPTGSDDRHQKEWS